MEALLICWRNTCGTAFLLFYMAQSIHYSWVTIKGSITVNGTTSSPNQRAISTLAL
jgi:hypothetical protein